LVGNPSVARCEPIRAALRPVPRRHGAAIGKPSVTHGLPALPVDPELLTPSFDVLLECELDPRRDVVWNARARTGGLSHSHRIGTVLCCLLLQLGARHVRLLLLLREVAPELALL